MKKLIASIFVLFSTLTLAPTALAGTNTEVIHSFDMATNIADVIAEPTSWFFYNDESDTIDNSLGSFVFGPSTPTGDGSVKISVTGTQRRNLATYQFSGTPLSTITTLAFSTYNPSLGNPGSINRSGYLNFNVDFDGTDSWQRRLVYVPSDNGVIMQNTWQEWETTNANSLWRYSGSTWPGTAIAGSTPRTWEDILSSYPGVRVRVTDSWLGVRVGEPYADGYTEYLDAFKFGIGEDITIFDFEPVARSAQINSPLTDQNPGMVTFSAFLTDDDIDPIQWAVRKGTCAASTGTVFGNVDGKNNIATTNTDDLLNQTFSFVGDMTGMELDMYCFVYNPTEDSGEAGIRLTQQFNLIALPEPLLPTTKDQCKKGGWSTFTSLDFKNQGSCVSYVVSNDHSGKRD